MPVITTSILKKLLCQTLIIEKLSDKIIFQNTTFLFSPLKLKNNFMTCQKIKFKKPLSVFKTNKIPNLHCHEVLRTHVRHCDMNPTELIWAQVKGFVAENNQSTFSQQSVNIQSNSYKYSTKDLFIKREGRKHCWYQYVRCWLYITFYNPRSSKFRKPIQVFSQFSISGVLSACGFKIILDM